MGLHLAKKFELKGLRTAGHVSTQNNDALAMPAHFAAEVQMDSSIVLLGHVTQLAFSANSGSDRCVDGHHRSVAKTTTPWDNTANGFIFHGRNSRDQI